MPSSYEFWIKEKETLVECRKENPELFVVPDFPEKEMLQRIGIRYSFPFRPLGYIRFYPEDFVVEEVSRNGEFSAVKINDKEISPPLHFHLGCSLLKIGVSTFDAITLLVNKLQIKTGRITYAGLKDHDALTSQKIVLQDLNPKIFEEIKKIFSSINKKENIQSPLPIFLTNFCIEEKKLLLGDLQGNQFTIFVRTKEMVDKDKFSREIEKIKKSGFLNFYHFQRFGTPRCLNHMIGKLILQGKYEEAVFNFLASSGPQEIPLIKEARQRASNFFGDWEKMKEILEEFPFTFRNEIMFVSYFEENPKSYLESLIFFKELTKIFIYSYVSYLFNRILSFDKEGLKLPEEMPLFLSFDKKDQNIYKFWLESDKVQNFAGNLMPFRFLNLKRRLVKTRIFPKNVLFKILPEGVILSFSLDKGAYATTLLLNLFELKEGLPLPEWVNKKEYDIKEEIGAGSIKEVKEIIKI